MKNNPNSTFENHFSTNEELDLKVILNFFIRNKLLIGSFSILFFVLFSLYSLTMKKIWQGQFQIVLRTNTENKNINVEPSFSRFVNLPQKKDLNTQVAILNSPSVLEPIFEFVVLSKQKKDTNFDISYSSWKKNNVDISLEENTSVLNIKYLDQDKELIIPLLEKMTFAYQEYSGKNKRRTQELTKNYLREQIALFKKKSSFSLKAVQDFAIEQDLSFLDNKDQVYKFSSNDLSAESIKKPMMISNLDIEKIRVTAANELRKIDIQLKKIEELNDSEELQYIGSTIPALVAEGLPQTLKEIETDLIEMRSKYTDKDVNIINLLEKRKLNIDYLKDRTKKYLKAYRLDVEAKMEAAIRPKGVLLKYKELSRRSARDELTLISLENQLRDFELEEAKTEDPWELITKPNLTKDPVAPSKKIIGLFGLFAGFLIGTITCFYKEKKSDLIFESQKLEEFLNTKVIERLYSEDLNKNSEKIIFIQTLFNLKKDKKIFVLYLEETEKQKFENLIEFLREKYNNPEQLSLISLKRLKQVSNNDALFLAASLKSLKITQIDKLRNRLGVLDLILDGIILID